MIVDTSAIVAVAFKEPGYETLVERLQVCDEAAIGTPTLAETAIVLSARMGRDARGLLSRLLEDADIDAIPFGEAHYRTAIHAWLQFGRGRHPASLNFSDCLCYAVAKLADQPLLCVGEDFSRTDLKLV